MNKNIIQKSIPHIVCILAIILVSVSYFYPQLNGKVLQRSDITVFKGMANEAKTFYENTGEQTLWTNSMFGGMPTYQISSRQKNNVFSSIQKVMQLGFKGPIGYFIFGSIAAYIMFLLLGVNAWLALIGALAISFTTNNVIIYGAGHASKTIAVMTCPLIIGGLWSLFRKKYWLGAVVFSVGMGLNVTANHYQMTYYLALMLVVYAVLELIQFFKNKDTASLGKIAAVGLFACVIAFAAPASKLLPTYEYSKDTMRGNPILEQTATPTSSSETDGLEYEYAMSWSNGFLDLFSSIIPRVVGGGGGELMPSDSYTVKDLRTKGVQQSGIRASTYWGSLPFTSGPTYFGVVFFFLMMLGFFIIKGPMKWGVLAALVISLILSMGKNAGALNEFVFNYFPLYNKFRTPMSILSVTAIFIPILGIMSIDKIIKTKDGSSYNRPLYIATGIMSAILLFFVLIAPGMYDFSSVADGRTGQMGFNIDALKKDRVSFMRSDALRSLLFVLATAGLVWSYIKFGFNKWFLIGGIAFLSLYDLIGVSAKYLNSESFVSERQNEAPLAPRQVDALIKKDVDPHYRVMDQTINPFITSSTSYHHKTIGGNHPAKLQRFEDLKMRHLTQGNAKVYNMLNTKYFIVPGANGTPESRVNTDALGNAWFVNNIKWVNTPNEEIDGLNNFDPANEVILHKEYENYLSGFSPNKNGTIKLTSYAPNKIIYESNSTADQLAVFSEMWYGPDKGWEATIDGSPVDHIRANYALRALKVPSGNHSIEFSFNPRIYRLGSTIGLIASILFVLTALGMIYFYYTQRTPLEVQEAVQVQKKTKLKKTTKKKKKK